MAKRQAKRLGIKIAALVALLAVLLLVLLSTAAASKDTPYSPENHKPNGVSALAEIARLRRGVTWEWSGSLEAALHRAEGGANPNGPESETMIVVTNPDSLSSEQAQLLQQTRASVLYLNSTPYLLKQIDGHKVSPNSALNSPEPGCAGAEGLAGQTSSPLAVVLDTPGCWPSGGGHMLVRYQQAGPRTILADATIMQNAKLTEHGNAAASLAALGSRHHAIWVRVSPAGPAELQSPEIAHLIGALAILFVTGALVFGRRFGPLVHEKLPVTVPSFETEDGRASLYRSGRDLTHATRVARENAVYRHLGALPEPGADLQPYVERFAHALGTSTSEAWEMLCSPPPTQASAFVTLISKLEGEAHERRNTQ